MDEPSQVAEQYSQNQIEEHLNSKLFKKFLNSRDEPKRQLPIYKRRPLNAARSGNRLTAPVGSFRSKSQDPEPFLEEELESSSHQIEPGMTYTLYDHQQVSAGLSQTEECSEVPRLAAALEATEHKLAKYKERYFETKSKLAVKKGELLKAQELLAKSEAQANAFRLLTKDPEAVDSALLKENEQLRRKLADVIKSLAKFDRRRAEYFRDVTDRLLARGAYEPS